MIETKGLTKIYGQKRAIDNIDLRLERGDVFGFIGPNGSGKTTTMRILATLLAPTFGEAYVCGHSIYTNPKEIRRLIGYMPDFFGVYDDMKVIEYLEFFAAAYRIGGAKRRAVCEEMLDLVNLAFKRDEMANTLSRGQTQRLGLARVLLHDPQILLLDEPASGLDPRARISIRELIKRLGSMGKTIMVSSHILPELADICNKVGMIEQGKLLVNSDVATIMRLVRRQPVLKVQVKGDPQAAAKLLESRDEVESVSINGIRITLKLHPGREDFTEISKTLIESGFGLMEFHEEEVNLETAFMELTKGLTA